ncbi:MAG: ABC transporter permease [Saprospiraceae bacterium]|jgi:putative ABC transport system permease protein|nr:ABC transporter permease [Saprospiraceae bacterium]
MLYNYFKIAYRSFLQNKLYAGINIIGLMTALSVVILIMLYVKDDLSFDKMHNNGSDIYRIVADVKDSRGEVMKTGNTGIIQGPTFKDEIPEIATFCRFKNGWNTLVKKGNDAFMEEMLYADSAAFAMFSFDVIEGDPVNPLNNIQNVVITQKVKEKYFGASDAIGKPLYISDESREMTPFIVAAVVGNLPSNSSIQFDILASFEYMLNNDEGYKESQSWANSSLNTFVMLHPKTDALSANQKIDLVTQKHLQTEMGERKKQDPTSKGYDIKYHLQPLFDMHLDPEYFASNGMKNWSNIKYPKILSGISLLLILIASINFINLTLARSLQRSKEIGIRKTSGGTKSQLFFQFITESFVLTAIASFPAVLIAYGLLPEFSKLTGKYLDPNIMYAPASIILYIVLMSVIAICAGSYPAIVMSGYRPIESLKGKSVFGSKQYLRQSLVVIQFVIAGILMIGTAFVTLQFRYINEKPLGYETSDRYRFWIPWEEISKLATPFKTELRQLNDVLAVSAKSGDFNRTKFKIEGEDTDWIYYEHIDDQHLQLLNIPLKEGRYFSYDYALDTVSNIVVNESFVQKILKGVKNPLQHPIKSRDEVYQIVGVVKDYHYSSLKEEISPIVYYLDRGTQAGMVHIQFKDGRSREGLKAVSSVYKKYVPFLPMEYESLEDFRMDHYSEELTEKNIITYTALLALLIACLGLFGLTTFMTEQRSKEIGIRKVLGAGVSGIAILLTKDFVRLVVISIILAIPVAYYFVNQWLENFSYRIGVQWWVFAIVAILALTIAFFTVFFQSIRAALADPVKSLKTE